LVGCDERGEEPVVDLGVEDGDLDSVAGESVAVGVKPVAASSVWHRAPVRAMTRGSPNRRAGVLPPAVLTVGCAIRAKAGLARTQP
jgi:hypothetical protein